MYETRPFPDFSWSHTRDRLLNDCARAYYYRYYAGHQGWLGPQEASAAARHAYRLKFLVTLHQVLGGAIHECARSCVEAVRCGDPLPSHTQMLTQVLGALRGACAASKNRRAFERNPKHHPMLHSVYYRGSWDIGEVAKVKEKVDRCLASLRSCSLWEELRGADPAGIVLIDQLEAVNVGGIWVYAAPDLVVRIEEDVTVVDWKTGAEGDEEVTEQLALYALVVIKRFRWRFDDHQWFGRIIRLNEGQEQAVDLTRLHLMRASHRIRESVELMRAYLEDFAENRPRPAEAFPLVHPAFRAQCCRCNFFELCRPEFGPPHLEPEM